MLFLIVVAVFTMMVGCKSPAKITDTESLTEDGAVEEVLSSEEVEVAEELDELKELDELSADLEEDISFEELEDLGLE